METTAKITSVQENQRSYNGKNGTIYIHFIKFEGDQENKTWEYHSQKTTCDKFKVGESATFITEVKVNGQYTNYKISPAKQDGFSGGKKGDPKDQGVITFLSLYSSTCNFYAQRGQVTIEDVLADTEKAFKKALEHSTLPVEQKPEPTKPVETTKSASNGTTAPAQDNRETLTFSGPQFDAAVSYILAGGQMSAIEKKYKVSAEVKAALERETSDLPF